MVLYKEYHTATRRDFGMLYLTLFRGVDNCFLKDPDNVPIILITGNKGKSFAVEVGMKEKLEGFDPMRSIEGAEQRTMFLEERPFDATYKFLHTHGTMDGVPITLGFSSAPDVLRRDFSKNSETLSESRRKDFENLKYIFKERVQSFGVGEHGGLIFVTNFWSPNKGDVWLECTVDSVKGSDFWNKKHRVLIESPKLLESEVFYKGLRQAEQWQIGEESYDR